MTMMKAGLFRRFKGPIRVEDVEMPKVAEDGVIVKVMATGVCRSDWHAWSGHDSDIKDDDLPHVPGHELSGIVFQVGDNVGQVKVGDRVAVPFILSCGTCRYCTHHQQPTVCTNQRQPGFTQWGSFAEYVHVPRADRNLRPLPANVSFLQAAALGCRFSTAYRAVLQQGKLKDKQTIAIFGCGGLGLSCIMMAATKSECTIIAIDISKAALAKGKEVGATHCIHISRDDSLASIRNRVFQLTAEDEGADITVDAAGFPSTCESAVMCTRPGGRMVQVGLPIGDRAPEINMGFVAGKEIEIVGSHGFSADDLGDLLNFVSSKKLDPTCLVEREVSLAEGCKVLETMDTSSPLGVVMISSFDENTRSNISRL